ncbi:unnamed protein product [Caenorhabditis brenneri]
MTWVPRLLQKASETIVGCTNHEVNYAVCGQKLRNRSNFTSQRKPQLLCEEPGYGAGEDLKTHELFRS